MLHRQSQIIEYLKDHPGSFLEWAPPWQKNVGPVWRVHWEGASERVHPLAAQALMRNGNELEKTEEDPGKLIRYALRQDEKM